MATTSEYPQYRSGDVLISLTLDGCIHNFKLHSDILARGSKWFDEHFYQNQAERGMYHLTLGGTESNRIPVLQKAVERSEASTSVQTPPRSPPHPSIAVPTVETPGSPHDTPQIKIEEDITVTNQPLPSETILAAYNHMFSAMYGIALQIPLNNAHGALNSCEIVLRVAKLYSALPIVRPYIGSIFSQYRQELWVAIKDNPPCWLKFAISLENAAIYAEALIHMVGAYPSWRWLTARRSMPQNVLTLVERKSKELDELCLEAEHDLFLNALLKPNGQPVELATDYETWMVTQMFRDYISTELYAAINERGVRIPNKIGHLYRNLKKGGDAYLPYDEVLANLETARHSDWMDLADDLKQLKKTAKRTVEHIAKNNLILDVEEHGVAYLTSTTIEESDFPWLKRE